MKLLTLLFTTILFFSCSENTTLEMGQKTSLKVKPVYDAGKVQFGEEIVATFKVENTGEYPLVISEVKGSCSCTVAEKPEEPIAPGKTGIIKATVKTDNAATGKMAKEVRIVANTEPSITLMRITAEVVR